MRAPSPRTTLPWLMGVSLLVAIASLVAAVFLGLAARGDAVAHAGRRMTAQSDVFAREIEADIGVVDMALLEAAAKPGPGQPLPRLKLLELPLTARYIGFMNVLNEAGDVIADPRSNVSRPVNFAGRDYFQDQLKNPGDNLMIGRPFGTAPNQHASIPISRRLTAPDGTFAGVVVAGLRLTWLSDLLSHELPGPPIAITIRRADGLILMRSPFDEDAIGRNGEDDPAWRDFLLTGVTAAGNGADGIRMFRRVATAPLVLELSLDRAAVFADSRSWLVVLPPLVIIPGLFTLLLGLTARGILRRNMRIEADANAANDERMRLLATISHELRTPLSGILGQAELLTEEGGFSDRQAMRLNRLTEAATLMRNTVNRVIGVVRPEDRDEPLVLAPCDLDALLRTCVSIVESAARKRGLQLIHDVEPSVPGRAMLASDLVAEVLINLLTNAVKYTGQGTIALRARGDATHVRFEVEDTGPGIPVGKWGRLFREYDRLDAARDSPEGTGIGLSISERLVRRMGGRIGYQHSPRGGSVFWVELPTGPAPSIVTSSAPNAAPNDTPNIAPLATPAIAPLRILLADDLDLTRSVTADFLRRAGHSITEVADGHAAIDAARVADFDVILTDMRMPIMDGMEAARGIRALPAPRGRTPVVLVTADLVALDEGASGQSGIDFCLMKPFTRAELLATVAKAAQGRPTTAAANAVLDRAAFRELRDGLGDTKFAAHLRAATDRVEDLLAMLKRPDAAESAIVGGAVHDLVGVSGLLGLGALSESLRRFDVAKNRADAIDSLREAATEAVMALRQQQMPAGASARDDGGY